jgi:hypothetical protein
MDLAQEQSEAKLTWVGPANALETIDLLHLTQEQRQFLSEIDDPDLRQTVRDHIVDQQFRRDIFVKGPLPLAKSLLQEKWLDMRFALTAKSSGIPREIQGTRHKISVQPEVYYPLIDALKWGPRTLRDVMTAPAMAQISLGRVIQALTFLCAQGACQPCLPEKGLGERKIQTHRFNKAVGKHARRERRYSHFAAPETGGGMKMDHVDQLIWLAMQDEETDPARFA